MDEDRPGTGRSLLAMVVALPLACSAFQMGFLAWYRDEPPEWRLLFAGAAVGALAAIGVFALARLARGRRAADPLRPLQAPVLWLALAAVAVTAGALLV
jgi:hypothetical protein